MESRSPQPARDRSDAAVGTCVRCGGSERRDGDVEETWTFGAVSFVLRVPAQLCTGCGESYVWGPDLGAAEDRVTRELVARSVADSRAVRWLRKRARLRGAELATLLGVTPETVSRWENGHHPMDRAPLALLGMLALDAIEDRTTTLDLLRRHAQLPNTGVVRLDAA
ncbi:MAG: type II toxin-antitoxin system MqsA family antitoxin [Deltaproteobacteria bacterium]|nr:type II toxin-antitoxin system MqsA family antitoxin [Deltaproteobacteria bacterium]